VNPRLYTERTWFDHVSDRFAAFTADEAGAILGYLSWIAHHRGDLDGTIAEAVGNFWLSKSLARETPPREPPGVDRRSRLDSVNGCPDLSMSTDVEVSHQHDSTGDVLSCRSTWRRQRIAEVQELLGAFRARS